MLKSVCIKNIFIFLFLNFSFNMDAQLIHDVNVDPQKDTLTVIFGKYRNRVFNSYEDYKNGRPVEGIKVMQDLNYKDVSVKENGTVQKMKIKDMKYTWFCDNFGMLMRVYKGELYVVIADGALSYYFKYEEAQCWKETDRWYVISQNPEPMAPPFKQYCSETINGEIKVFRGKVLEEYLAKAGLSEQYKTDIVKREFKDTVWMYRCKEINHTIKYCKLINSKIG